MNGAAERAPAAASMTLAPHEQERRLGATRTLRGAGAFALLCLLAVPTALAAPITPAGTFTEAGSIQWFPVLLAVLGTGGVVTAAYVSIAASKAQGRRPKRRRTKVKVVPKQTPARRETVVRPVVRERSLPATVELRFPDIPGDFPDVWGAGEDITILVAARDPDGKPAANGRIELTVAPASGGSAERLSLHANAEGLASIPRRFSRPADLVATARLLVNDRPVAEGKRELRIVDYRQEIVETFKDFKAFAAERFPSLDAKATPREFCDRFYDQNPRAPMRELDRIAYVQELANYSDHPIDRSHYVEMVRAFLELERAGVLGEGE